MCFFLGVLKVDKSRGKTLESLTKGAWFLRMHWTLDFMSSHSTKARFKSFTISWT